MKTIVNRLPLTKARVNLGQVVRRAHVNREFFILEKDGIPVVGLMHVDDLEAVSYTHLDVYKRQDFSRILLFTARSSRSPSREIPSP